MASIPESDFTPATWLFPTCNVMFIGQVVWTVATADLSLACHYVMIYAAHLCTLAWFHFVGLGLQQHALAAIAVAAAILQGVVYVSDRQLCSDVIPQDGAGCCLGLLQAPVPVGLRNWRLLWHCGLDLYATWAAMVTVVHVAGLLVVVAGLRVSTAHAVAHGTLLFLLLARFSFDSLVFPKATRHRVTPYLVVMATVMAVLQTNWHAASRTWEWCVIAVTCLMVALQTALTCALRHRGVRLEQIA